DTKNTSCGEGGALLINDERFVERAHIVREKGTNRRQMLRGEVDKYTWVDCGSSFLPSEVTAAFLLALLEAAGATAASLVPLWRDMPADAVETVVAEAYRALAADRPGAAGAARLPAAAPEMTTAAS